MEKTLQNVAFNIPALHSAYADGANPDDMVSECFRRIEVVTDPGIFLHLMAVSEQIGLRQSATKQPNDDIL